MSDESAAREGIVLVDLGNSSTCFGVACAGKLVDTWSVATRAELTCDEAELSLLTFLDSRCPDIEIVDSAMCSVVPTLTSAWAGALERVAGRRPLTVGPGLKSGLKMHLSNPADLGADRVTDCVAAKKLYGAPVMVVDFGTATNIEVIDEDGVLLGGMIAPGLHLAANAVSQAAAQLPLVELKTPKSVIGTTTRDAMQSGIVIGEVARIDGLIEAAWRELGYETQVIATGSDAEAMTALSQRIDAADDLLGLKGLLLLHKLNRPGKRK